MSFSKFYFGESKELRETRVIKLSRKLSILQYIWKLFLSSVAATSWQIITLIISVPLSTVDCISVSCVFLNICKFVPQVSQLSFDSQN